MAVSGVSGSPDISSTAKSRATIADNFDTFLQLLTTQLRNQNPLDPLDTNQFTQQLVQFSGIEQQLKTNDFLQAMMQSTQAATNSQAVSYIGKEVTTSGVQADLKDGQAAWAFNLKDRSENVTITIKDSAGNTVFTHKGAAEAGPGTFTWDGVGSDGKKRISGTFSISVDARNATNGSIPVATEGTGKVTSVDFSGDEPVLLVGSARIKLSSVIGVRLPATPPPTTSDTD